MISLKDIPFSYMWILNKSISDVSGVRTVLDLGTADGALMKQISKNTNWSITGVDIYPKWVNKARKSKVYKKVILGDLVKECRKLVDKKTKYDVVFCSQTIEHISRKDGEELLVLSAKLAKKRCVFGTPRGYMHQPTEFLGDNPYQKHKSGWSIKDFTSRGYKVNGVGFSLIWSEEGLARSSGKAKLLSLTAVSFLLSPIVYFVPSLAAGILCIKDMQNEK